MNLESSLRARQVPDGQAAAGVALNHLICVVEIGADSVDAYAEEAARGEPRLELGQL